MEVDCLWGLELRQLVGTVGKEFRFEGDESEIDLGAHHEVEFDLWRWADLNEALDAVAPFKRDAYRQVIAAFAELTKA